jgi:uncharacterized membrane protein
MSSPNVIRRFFERTTMIRGALLFLTALLSSLTAGRAFWAWLGESPFGMSAQTYVEFFQQLDRRIAIPVAVTGIGGTLLAGVSAALHRNRRTVCYLLVAACACGVVGSLVTALVNVPINKELATWNPAALPDGYEAVLRRWWVGHHVRLVAMLSATCLVFAAMLVPRRP